MEVSVQLDEAVLTLSSTLRQRSAPHRDATRFSLSSSWLRFSTHSFTAATSQRHTRVTRQHTHTNCWTVNTTDSEPRETDVSTDKRFIIKTGFREAETLKKTQCHRAFSMTVYRITAPVSGYASYCLAPWRNHPPIRVRGSLGFNWLLIVFVCRHWAETPSTLNYLTACSTHFYLLTFFNQE